MLLSRIWNLEGVLQYQGPKERSHGGYSADESPLTCPQHLLQQVALTAGI